METKVWRLGKSQLINYLCVHPPSAGNQTRLAGPHKNPGPLHGFWPPRGILQWAEEQRAQRDNLHHITFSFCLSRMVQVGP